ncbi:ATP-dependent zinc protease [Aphanothece hegewaldii CCALA 016]|uniref:ATP-dependent zinc protease n=1 Tax=Aphanothece hegewaldii CCALA 016 TaxID=2107694 RepID=A0A2T1LWZ0_9CHRO|nr:RimK/LysX family protein [Aphanothece hegewaldii]PSF36629.1 ATP-dependent zinc protease [Aphanothece hegewaldii CCALA 016]
MKKSRLPIIGWREWLDLPELGITNIKAKIDTGARSSALHAIHLKTFEQNNQQFVSFQVHPHQRDSQQTVFVSALLLEWRKITNSGGQTQLRPVIQTSITLGKYTWPIELTLTNRDMMGFRMLLGREALRERFLVNPSRSFLLGHFDFSKNY